MEKKLATEVNWDELTFNVGFTYLIVFVNEELQLSHGDSQVRFIEAVLDIPAEGSKLAPLLHQSMEEAQTVEELFKYLSMHKLDGNLLIYSVLALTSTRHARARVQGSHRRSWDRTQGHLSMIEANSASTQSVAR